ncbi:hypothetical protein CD191_03445 [Paenibacillus odorifer]|uniref:Uncharacterized protein n=1 Tax=Paenibacillus odorifer TaxID=189426 RepID=A0AAD0P194_9BACL|nr:hypothetical protein CD191_03445 [Paenibacillus odorifer]
MVDATTTGGLGALEFPGFPEFPGFRGSGVPGFRGSGVPGFRGSGVPGFRGSRGSRGFRTPPKNNRAAIPVSEDRCSIVFSR